MGYLKPGDEPFYARVESDFGEDESGAAYVQIEDWELEDICERVLQMVRLATYAVRMENEDVMIKRGSKSRQNNSGSGNANGLEYLGVKHLTEDKGNPSSEFEILWAGTPESANINNKFGALVSCKVQRVSSGQRYWWMLSDENPNLDSLCDNMSDDEKKWVGRHVLIFIEVEQPSEKKFLRSEVLPAAAAKAAAAK